MGKNTSRPYHCTFHCWCNNYAKANNIWQTFKNASSQNVHTDTLPRGAPSQKPSPSTKLKLVRSSVFLLQMFLIICNSATN